MTWNNIEATNKVYPKKVIIKPFGSQPSPATSGTYVQPQHPAYKNIKLFIKMRRNTENNTRKSKTIKAKALPSHKPAVRCETPHPHPIQHAYNTAIIQFTFHNRKHCTSTKSNELKNKTTGGKILKTYSNCGILSIEDFQQNHHPKP